MNRCLVTKLNGSSNNSELLRLGEMRIKIAKVENPTKATQGFRIDVLKPVTLEIVSDGYFTDETLATNKGKTITLVSGANSIWVSNDDVEIAILDKYSVSMIAGYYISQPANEIYAKNICLDISGLKYSAAMTSLSLSDSQVTGDISNLKNLTALTILSLYKAKVTGDIANLKNLTALTAIDLRLTQVTGDIANLKNLTALTILSLSNVQTPITGHIDNLSGLAKCNVFNLNYCKLTGDLATLPASCKFISFKSDKGSVFTWGTRPSTSTIIALECPATVNNIDKMLQDLAQCQVGFTSSDPVWYKTIQAAGKRTAASDDAVTTLQQKGYTVSIAK